MEKTFERNTFKKRLSSMWKTDARRLRVSPLFYIMVAIAFVAPILILVMTTMMDGTVSVNPQTGKETVMEGFDYVWQILGSLSGAEGAQVMDLTTMCNGNLTYFAIAVFACVFICADFKSGYAKNLFAVRAKKTEYVISKTLVCSLGGCVMIAAFVLGAIVGGGVASLPFETPGFSGFNLLCAVACKMLLVPVFVSVFLTMSVIAKQKTWLAICLSLCVGAFLFTVVSIASPLNAGIFHIATCLIGCVGFAFGMGAISNAVLKKTSLA